MVAFARPPIVDVYTLDLLGETPLRGEACCTVLMSGTVQLRLCYDSGRKLVAGQRGQRAFRRLVAQGVLTRLEAGRLFGAFLCDVCKAAKATYQEVDNDDG